MDSGPPHAARASTLVRALILFFIVMVLMGSARSFLPSGVPSQIDSGTALAFGFLVLAATQFGEIASGIGLPRLTGYLLCGLAVGPDVLGLLTTQMVSSLRLVGSVAVGIIAFSAGCELDLRQLRPRLKSIASVFFCALPLALIGLTLTTGLLSDHLPFLHGLPLTARWVAALTLSVVVASMSPSVTLAILSETSAAGILTDTVLGVVVLGDIAIIILFALAHAASASVFGGASTGSSLATQLAVEILGSAVVGGALAIAIALYHRRISRNIVLLILAVCIVAAEVGARLHLDPLLICLAAGLTLGNGFNIRGHELARVLAPASLPIFTVFFALAGAKLHLADLRMVGPLVLVFFFVRAVSLSGGALLGARLAGAEPVIQRWIPAAVLPQAGVSVGLAELLARHFPTWGAGARALILSVITLNELCGPLLLRTALVRAGEANQRTDPPE